MVSTFRDMVKIADRYVTAYERDVELRAESANLSRETLDGLQDMLTKRLGSSD